jgi:hypothetical protein
MSVQNKLKFKFVRLVILCQEESFGPFFILNFLQFYWSVTTIYYLIYVVYGVTVNRWTETIKTTSHLKVK